MSQDKGNDLTTEDSEPTQGFTESPKTAPLQDHIDSILREFRKNVLINDDALAEMEATQQIMDIVHHRERIAAKAERKKLTWEAVDSKLIVSDATKIEFWVELKDRCSDAHYCVYSSDGKNFSVAMDGHSVISRTAEINKEEHERTI